VYDYAEAGDLERSPQRPPVLDDAPRVREHLERRRGDLDPGESGRLDRLECCRTGPPPVRHVEAEPFAQLLPCFGGCFLRIGSIL
jgi:hypothetical protein